MLLPPLPLLLPPPPPLPPLPLLPLLPLLPRRPMLLPLLWLVMEFIPIAGKRTDTTNM